MQMLEPARARIRPTCPPRFPQVGGDLDLKFDPYYLTSFIRSVGRMMLKRVKRKDGKTQAARLSRSKNHPEFKMESALYYAGNRSNFWHLPEAGYHGNINRSHEKAALNNPTLDTKKL